MRGKKTRKEEKGDVMCVCVVVVDVVAVVVVVAVAGGQQR